MEDFHEKVKNVEIWKIKKLIKSFEAARGNGTSMISLIIRPGDRLSRVTKMLGHEFNIASDIKSRVNGQSLLWAISSAQETLNLYHKVPPNGLVLYTGTVVTNNGKEKKVTIDFEPFKPIKASLYLCDNKFHTEALNQLLVSDNKFGFIIMDDDGVLFGTLSGNTRKVLHNSGDRPQKHESGGMSPPHLRMEKQGDHVRKTAELATQFFINPATSQPNVSGLILAGLGGFKTEELSQSDMFDSRLQAKILNVLDLSYRGEYLYGFGQAVRLSSELLADEKFIQEEEKRIQEKEKGLIVKYFEEITQDTGKYVIGIDDTLKALAIGAVETLILWENLDINRYVLKNSSTGEIVIKHLNKDEEADQSSFRDAESSAELEVQEKIALLEWFAVECERFGCTFEFVTDKTEEGSQFCRIGGIGGILRYQLDMRSFELLPDEEAFIQKEKCMRMLEEQADKEAFIQEKEKSLIVKYFEEITQDTGKYVIGIDDTLKALAIGAVETLILWENLDINRYVLKNSSTGEIVIKHLNKDEEADQSSFRDAESSAELEVQEKIALREWFAINCKRFGCTYEPVTDKSEEGSQFCRIGGIGGILRLELRLFDEPSDEEVYIDSNELSDGEAYEDSD